MAANKKKSKDTRVIAIGYGDGEQISFAGDKETFVHAAMVNRLRKHPNNFID